MKRQPKEWDRISANHSPVRNLYTEYTKNYENSIIKTSHTPIKSWAKDLNRHFPKQICRWLISTRKDWSAATLLAREMQVKTTRHYHFTSTKMSTVRQIITSVD